jgi:glycosyltransferase involved in cell wall biosynthesis
LRNRCKKNSYSASLVATVEAYAHKAMHIRNMVTGFISPSNFLKNKFMEFGWPNEKLHFNRNFLLPADFEMPRHREGRYALYMGQLESWKGVDTLLEAWPTLDEVELRICGDGSARIDLQTKAQRLKLNNVKFMGHQSQDSLKTMLASCLFVVVPSDCYENCPYSVLEAMAYGKPVISTKMGGLPELVEHNITGLLFEAGDAQTLAEHARLLSSDRDFLSRLGHNARQKALIEFSADRHYSAIMNIYQNITH